MQNLQIMLFSGSSRMAYVSEVSISDGDGGRHHVDMFMIDCEDGKRKALLNTLMHIY